MKPKIPKEPSALKRKAEESYYTIAKRALQKYRVALAETFWLRRPVTGASLDNVQRRILDLFPDAEIGQDNDGQLVIYTGLQIVYDARNKVEKVTPIRDSQCV